MAVFSTVNSLAAFCDLPPSQQLTLCETLDYSVKHQTIQILIKTPKIQAYVKVKHSRRLSSPCNCKLFSCSPFLQIQVIHDLLFFCICVCQHKCYIDVQFHVGWGREKQESQHSCQLGIAGAGGVTPRIKLFLSFRSTTLFALVSCSHHPCSFSYLCS